MSADQHDTTVRRSFSRQVGLFTGEASPFARRTTNASDWIGRLEPHMVVLDVACGAAHATEQVAPLVRLVVGVDLTPALLRTGADRLRANGIDNVLLLEGSAEHLPFLDGSFEVVTCRSALHHFVDPRCQLTEMARVCRPGGRVVVADMIAPPAGERTAFDDLHRLMDPSHVATLSEAELCALLESTVGALDSTGSVGPFPVPIEGLLSEVADRAAVISRLRADLEGGPPTGFHPLLDGDRILVSFTVAVVQAMKPGVGARRHRA